MVPFCCLILSCDLNEPTDRFLDSSVQEPRVESLDSMGIRPGQHIAGMVVLDANVSSLSSPVTSVNLILDDSLIQRSFNPPYTLQLDTRLRTQGEHQLTIAVTETDPRIGLLGITGFPTLLFSGSVVFDQTPPTAVALQSVVWENGYARLSWTRNNDLNFYAYIVSQESNWRPSGESGNILDPSRTTYIDSTAPQLYGINLTYRTKVFNRDITASSNAVGIRFGDTLSSSVISNSIPGQRPIMNPALNEMYLLPAAPNGIIRAVSVLNHNLLRTRSIVFAANFALSGDGSTIYVVSYNSSALTVLEAATFNLVRTSTLSFPVSLAGSIVSGRPNRLYMTSGSFAGGRVKVVDANTGSLVTETSEQAPDGLLAISPDNNTLYVASGTSVYRVDVTTDSVRVVAQRTALYSVQSLQLSPDGSRLYLGHVYAAPSNYVDVWSSDTLGPITRITAGEQLFDFYVTSSSVYLSESRSSLGGTYFLPGRVVQYSAGSLTPQAFWDFVQVPRIIVTSSSQQFLYAFGSPPLIVPVNQ